MDHHRSFILSPRCAHCGDVIGVYEQLVAVLADRIARATSRAAEPHLISAPGASLYHVACYEVCKGP